MEEILRYMWLYEHVFAVLNVHVVLVLLDYIVDICIMFYSECLVLDEFCHSFALFKGPSTVFYAVWFLLIVGNRLLCLIAVFMRVVVGCCLIDWLIESCFTPLSEVFQLYTTVLVAEEAGNRQTLPRTVASRECCPIDIYPISHFYFYVHLVLNFHFLLPGISNIFVIMIG